MSYALFAIVEAALIASSLSLDAFTAGIAYGSNKTKIPMLSVIIINLICCAITGISLFAGIFIKPYIPHDLTLIVSFIILFIIGSLKLLDSTTKSIIRKYSNFNKEIKGSAFNFKFVLNLYANPEVGDLDASKHISSIEAALLALSLSLDGIIVGFGAALANVNSVAVLLWSLVTNAMFLLIGHFIGGKIASKTSFNISWLSGVALIGLAFAKLF